MVCSGSGGEGGSVEMLRGPVVMQVVSLIEALRVGMDWEVTLQF